MKRYDITPVSLCEECGRRLTDSEYLSGNVCESCETICRGGQGRTSEDIKADGGAIITLALGVLVLLAGVGVWTAAGWVWEWVRWM